jgi:hypothetical protein
MSKIHQPKGGQNLSPAQVEDYYVRLLESSAGLARYLQIEGDFVFFMDLSRDFFLGHVLRDMGKDPLRGTAKDDAGLKTMLTEGAAKLDKEAMGLKAASYRTMSSEDDRVAILKSMEGDAFFQKIRGNLVTGLYNNKNAWPLFGYEGESASKGGYIDRGFNDIDWL